MTSSRTVSLMYALLCLTSLGILSLPAAAQAGLTLPPFTPIISVSPAVAAPGVERTISIAASWPDGCPPMNATLVASPAPGSTAITIRFSIPQTLVACTQVVTPYSGSLTFTPTVAGVQKIAVTLNDGRLLGEGSLVTRAADGQHSRWDLSGAWSEASTNGSGMALFHSHAGSDALAGTWHVYDTSGRPFWYLIQNGRWDSDTVFTGTLVQTGSVAGSCPISLPACQRTLGGSQTAATIRLEALDQDRLQVTIASAGPPSPGLVIGTQFVANRLRF